MPCRRVALRGTHSSINRRATQARQARAASGVYNVSQPAPKTAPKGNHKARNKPKECLASRAYQPGGPENDVSSLITIRAARRTPQNAMLRRFWHATSVPGWTGGPPGESSPENKTSVGVWLATSTARLLAKSFLRLPRLASVLARALWFWSGKAPGTGTAWAGVCLNIIISWGLA